MRTSHLQYPETMPKIQLLRQPYAGALSKDEIQSLEELDSERLSANWHIVLLRTYCKTPLPSVWKKAQTIPIIF